MIIAPYKSKYFQLDFKDLKNAMDNPRLGIDAEKILFIPKGVEGDNKEVYFTVLVAACLIDNEELVDCILNKGANVNFGVDYYGNSCAHIAIQFGNLNILKKLITHGADLEDRRSWQKATLLHTAVYRKNYKIVKYLIEQGADVNSRSHAKYERITPLVTAVELELKDIVELLLNNGAENICFNWPKEIFQKNCPIGPRKLFVDNTLKFQCNIWFMKYPNPVIVPPEIDFYYCRRIFDIGYSLDKVSLLYSGEETHSNPDVKIRRWNVNSILKKNIIITMALKETVRKAEVELVEGEAEFDSFLAECQTELNCMKNIPFVGSCFSWYDILYKKPSELTEIFEKYSFSYDLDDLEQIFPLFGGMLFYFFWRATEVLEMRKAFITLTSKL